MIYCSSCGTANRDGSRYCNECGDQLHALSPCSSCGFLNLTSARFCNNCGVRLSLAPAADATPVPLPRVEEEEEPLESDVPSAFEPDASPSGVVQPADLAVSTQNAEAGRGVLVEERWDKLDDEYSASFAQADGDALGLVDALPGQALDGASAESGPQAGVSATAQAMGPRPDGDGKVDAPVGALEEVENDLEPGVSQEWLMPSWLKDDDAAFTGGLLGAGERGVAPGDRTDKNIVVATSATSSRSKSASQIIGRASDDAGEKFDGILARPWQEISQDGQPDGSKPDGGRELDLGSQKAKGLLYIVLSIIVLLLAAVASSQYITDPERMNDAIEAGRTMLKQAIDGILFLIRLENAAANLLRTG